MKKIKLTVSYDGTNYVGWQVQKNGTAVEAVINEALSRLLGEDITILGASRTDSGVHALGNTAVFETETRIPPEKICMALNQILPDDIKIVRSEEVPADFHPRYHAKTKTYRYRIINCCFSVPTERLYADYVYYELDVEKMRKGAEYLVGEHDFIAFSTAGGQQKTSVRRIDSIEIETRPLSDVNPSCRYEPKEITITVTGNGFLYNMVRIIAGTLEKVGMGVYPPEHVKEILDSKDRLLSAPKAKAAGLTLVKIDYESR